MIVREVCPATKKVITTTSRVNTSTNNSTASKDSTPVPMDVSQMCSDVPKSEAEGQESDSYQYEQDQDCDGDELCAVKGKDKKVVSRPASHVECEDTRQLDAGRKGKGKGGKGELGERNRRIQRNGWIQKVRVVKSRSHVGQFLV